MYISCRCSKFTNAAENWSKWSWKLRLEFVVYISNSDRKHRSENSCENLNNAETHSCVFPLYLSMSSFPWETYFKEGKSVELPLGTSVSFRFQLKDTNSMIFCNSFVVALLWSNFGLLKLGTLSVHELEFEFKLSRPYRMLNWNLN